MGDRVWIGWFLDGVVFASIGVAGDCIGVSFALMGGIRRLMQNRFLCWANPRAVRNDLSHSQRKLTIVLLRVDVGIAVLAEAHACRVYN